MEQASTDPRPIADKARRVLLKMGQWNIPLTPQNYHVWYEYLVGNNEELKRAVESVMDSPEGFSPAANQSLYNAFFSRDRDDLLLRQAQQETQQLLKAILDEVLSTTAKASDYGAQLRGYSDKLNMVSTIEELQSLVKDMIAETTHMAETSSMLRRNLEKANADAESLRHQLKDAEQQALTDPLTGLNNRLAVERRLESLFDEFYQFGTIFSVVMMDIDHFKRLNDTHGHRVGDAVLRMISGCLDDSLKGRDFPGRYGGEEFIALLPGTTLENACSVAEIIREQIGVKRFRLTKTHEYIDAVTLSLGVSQVCCGDTADSVIERADQALYLAKRAGRNNVKTERDLSESDMERFGEI